MQAILLSREEVALRAKQLYESSIRQKVETQTVYLRLVLAGDLKVIGRSWYNAEGGNVFTDIACE